jgi:hypothetical protein
VNKTTRNIILLFGLLGILAVWYVIATGYDYADLAGTYKVTLDERTCILKLNKDHTFIQELNHNGNTEMRYGTWRRYGQAHVSFSREFVPLKVRN